VTFSLKNYIGIQDDKHRLIDHDYALNRKIADLQEVAKPSLIAIDAIVAGKGRMLTPEPVQLDMVICGENPVAVDSTCSRILRIEPENVDHIRFASERGHGPMDEESIELRGDVTLEEARRRAASFDNAMIPVSEFCESTPIRAMAGPPPDSRHHDYCWGGCPGAVEEAIDILKAFYPTSIDDIRPMIIVYGDCRGRDLETRPGERVFFYGDCCRFDGRINGEKVVIDSTYVERENRDPKKERTEDLVFKIVKSFTNAALSSMRTWVRIPGCPVSVAEHVLFMSLFGRVPNPYFDRRVTPRFCIEYVRSHAGRIRNLLVPPRAPAAPATLSLSKGEPVEG
jgi:hypothetical protein